MELNDPMLIGVYIAALRSSTICNEATGTLTEYLRFLGYRKEEVTTAKHGNLHKIKNAFEIMSKLRILSIQIKDIKSISPQQFFRIPFGPSAGWRKPHESLDAKFSFKEIETAASKLNLIDWPYNTDFGTILFLAGYLRTQMTLRFCTYKEDGTEFDHTGTFNFDAITADMHWDKARLVKYLEIARKLQLLSYRTLTFQLPSTHKGAISGKRLRYLLVGNYGNAGTRQVTARAKDLKALHSDCDCIHDSAFQGQKGVIV